MKYFSVLIVAYIVSSCCGTQKTTQSQPTTKDDIAVVTEVPDVIDTPSIPEPLQSPKVKSEEKTKDSTNLGFHQNLTKRTLTEHQLWNELLKKHVSDNGNVNYSDFKKDHKELLGYIRILQITHEKVNIKIDRTKDELLAYWINAYNALTVDLIIRNYPTNSIKDIKDPWDQRLWEFGDKWYNLNDIEHQILRKMNEPRIHFAIVCASVSCPKLQNEAYTASNLEEQLTIATQGFLADTSKNEITKNRIKLSKIFKWFANDFKTEGTLVDFLNQYSDITISESAKKSFKDYDWDLNN